MELGTGDKKLRNTENGKGDWKRPVKGDRYRRNTDNWRSNPANREYDKESEFIDG